MNQYHNDYIQQVRLLARLLISVNREKAFALKGGTAINLFIRDLPRLSIDIDLTYLPLHNRKESLENIQVALLRIQTDIEKHNRGVVINQKRAKNQQLHKLIVGQMERIKIEPNEVLRGSIYPPEFRPLSPKAQELLDIDIGEIQMLSFQELYAGKICAALDRQHPRDLFDIMLLLENEGFTDEIRQAFVVYLASSPRPMNELLNPRMLDIKEIYEKEFVGMTNIAVNLDTLYEARKQLVEIIQNALEPNEWQFLLSFKQGEPQWDLMPIAHLNQLPAIQWKLLNIRKMTPDARQKSLEKLKAALKL